MTVVVVVDDVDIANNVTRARINSCFMSGFCCYLYSKIATIVVDDDVDRFVWLGWK